MDVGVSPQSGDLLLLRYLAFHTNYVQIVRLLSTCMELNILNGGGSRSLRFLEPSPVTESHVIYM